MADYIFPILGGVFIGISAVLLMYLLGRISGISGIFYGAVQPSADLKFFDQNRRWRWLFIVGLPIGAILASALFNVSIPSPPSNNIFFTITAGLLVGFGTKLGSGCTSGHGVCGISRFSLRSLTATVVFIALGIITVLVVNAAEGKA